MGVSCRKAQPFVTFKGAKELLSLWKAGGGKDGILSRVQSAADQGFPATGGVPGSSPGE